jgi:hypothetical protein
MTLVLLGNPDEMSLEMYVKKLDQISHLFDKGIAVHAMKTLKGDDGGGGGGCDNIILYFFLRPPTSNPGLSRW